MNGDEVLYLSVRGLASALSVHRRTIVAWLRNGTLRGMVYRVVPHWTDPKRKTDRGRWLVELASVEELLTRMYEGQQVPPAIARRLRAMAKPRK